jgi:hypothetical protein
MTRHDTTRHDTMTRQGRTITNTNTNTKTRTHKEFQKKDDWHFFLNLHVFLAGERPEKIAHPNFVLIHQIVIDQRLFDGYGMYFKRHGHSHNPNPKTRTHTRTRTPILQTWLTSLIVFRTTPFLAPSFSMSLRLNTVFFHGVGRGGTVREGEREREGGGEGGGGPASPHMS